MFWTLRGVRQSWLLRLTAEPELNLRISHRAGIKYLPLQKQSRSSCLAIAVPLLWKNPPLLMGCNPGRLPQPFPERWCERRKATIYSSFLGSGMEQATFWVFNNFPQDIGSEAQGHLSRRKRASLSQGPSQEEFQGLDSRNMSCQRSTSGGDLVGNCQA